MNPAKTRSQVLMSLSLASLLLLALTLSPTQAGEPISASSTGGFITWPAGTIMYATDDGTLGTLTNAQANTLVANAFTAWSTGAIPTSSVSTMQTGTITFVTLDGDNDVETGPEFTNLACQAENAIVYDTVGQIIDDLNGGCPGGPGTCPSDSILGFAGPCSFDPVGGTINRGRALLNGKFSAQLDNSLLSTAIHEFGHFLGLGHSQVNLYCFTEFLANNGPTGPNCPSNSDDILGEATMFPVSFATRELGSTDDFGVTLSSDDRAWISFLYPTAAFNTTYGRINGAVQFSDGATGAQGVNVIARQVDNLGTPLVDESRTNATSCVSGFRAKADHGNMFTGFPADPRGTSDAGFKGTYEIPVLPGDYTVEVESIFGGSPQFGAFTGGSSVGPHARSEGFGGRGVVIANPGPDEFYSGAGESNSDGAPGAASTVTVTGGGNMQNGINIILNGTAATFDIFESAIARNDTRASATLIGNGTFSASVSPFNSGDFDVYRVNLTMGTMLTVETVAGRLPLPSPVDTVLAIRDSSGILAMDFGVDPGTCGGGASPCTNDDLSGMTSDSMLTFTPPSTGTFYIIVTDAFTDGRPDFQYSLVVTGAQAVTADLSATNMDNPDPANSGLPVVYTVTVTNAGPGVATSVQVTDVLSGVAFTFNMATASQGSCAGTGTMADPVICMLGNIPSGGSATITINATPTATGTLTNTVQSVTTTANDPTPPALIAQATTVAVCDVTSAQSGNWDTGSTWVGGVVPTAGQNVCVVDPHAVTIPNSSTQSANSLVHTSSQPFTISGGGSLTLAAASSIGAGGLNLAGTLGGGGIVTVTGPLTWSGGAMSGAGATTANGGGSITANVSLNQRTLNTAGTMTWSGGGMAITNSTWNNIGTLDITGFNNNIGLGGNAVFNNMGTVTKSAGGGTATFGSSFQNSGTVNADNGDLRLIAGGTSTGIFNVVATLTFRDIGVQHTLTGTSSVTGAGTVSFGSGTTDIAGAYNVTGTTSIAGGTANFNSPAMTNLLTASSGNLGGTGTLTASGAFTWSGFCTLLGSGATTANGGGTISADVALSQRTLNTAGTMTWSSGTINVGNGAMWNNTGTLDITGNDRTLLNLGGANLTFNNMGTLTKSAGGGTTTFNSIFNNSGTVNAANGILRLTSSGTSSGMFNAAATLSFLGTHTLTGTSSVTGAGTVAFDGGTTNINGAYNVSGTTSITSATANFNSVASANLLTVGISGIQGGTGTLTVTGAFTWFAGTLNGAGATNANGGGSIINNVSLSQRTLNTAGTMTWSGGGVGGSNGAMWNNTGTLNITGDNDITGGANMTFNNMGTVNKMTGVGLFQWAARFNNSATFNVNSGTLSFLGGSSFTQTAGSTTLNGGNIGGGVITLNFNGGTLGGVGTITSNVNNTGAIVAPGLSPGILNVAGTYAQAAGGFFNVEVNGLTAGTQFDQMNMTGAATLAGTLNVTLGFVPNLGDTFTIMTFASRGGTTFTTENLPALGGGNQLSVTYNPTSVVLSVVPSGPSNYAGPSPYLSVNDSPFLATIQAGTTALETFEDGFLNTPGVTASTGSVIGPGGATDSVDADDGVIDGSGTNGRSFFSGSGATGITFTFNATVLGGFPTRAGIAWTDGGGTTSFEAFDASGTSLGVFGPFSIADGSIGGTTGEDRFFSVTFAGGISAIKISNTSGGIEVDHLQYGPIASPVNVNLVLTKTDSPDPVAVGGSLTYTLSVNNNGTSLSGAATLTDTLPASVTFVSATPSQGTCSGTTTVTCTLGTIAAGATATVSIVVTPGVTGTITNTATVTMSSATNETFLFDNTASAGTTVSAAPTADLSVTKTGSAAIVLGSGNLTYMVSVTNGGPSPATNITVTDTLPAGVTFVSAAGTGWTCNQAAGVITCTRASLAVGAAPAITIVVTPTAVGMITNNVTAMAAESDPDNTNNSAMATTTVNASADLSIMKTDAPDPAIVNANLTYTITVNNAAGGSPATMLTMTDVLPANTTFQSLASPAGWTCMTPAVGMNGTVTCTNPNLASGAAAAVFTLVVRPTAAGNLSNTATIASATADPDNTNNSRTATTTVNLVAPATDFSLTATPIVASVMPGQSGTYTVTVGPLPVGSNFASAIMLACSSPTGSCTISPNSLTPGLNPANATMTVSTQELAASAIAPPGQSFLPAVPVTLYIIGPWAMGLLLIFTGWFGRRYRRPRLALCHTLGLLVLIASFFITQSACTNDKQVVIGPYAVTVTGTSGTITHTTVVVLNVIK